MAAVLPPLAMILLVALIFYLAWWQAYRDRKESPLKWLSKFVKRPRP